MDMGVVEAVEPGSSLVGEDVFMGWLYPVFGEFGMDFVFEACSHSYQVGSVADNVSEVSHMFVGDVAGG